MQADATETRAQELNTEFIARQQALLRTGDDAFFSAEGRRRDRRRRDGDRTDAVAEGRDPRPRRCLQCNRRGLPLHRDSPYDDQDDPEGESVIFNIVDDRTQRFRWKSVIAIIEPTWHDNDCAAADQAEPVAAGIDHEERRGLSVSDAVAWATALAYPVTLYLYDDD
jgi:hypothetical protein